MAQEQIVVDERLERIRTAEREAWATYVHAVNHENDDVRELAEVAWLGRFRDLRIAEGSNG